MAIEFTCKLCNTKHPSIEVDENGIAKLPVTITTQQDRNKCWYFCCVKCVKEETA